MYRISLLIIMLITGINTFTQPDRWQQKISYNINVDMEVNTNRLSGMEKIEYWNNSPDTLSRIFFHTYWNAFQPNSMMDVRSRNLGKTPIGLDKDGNLKYDWDDRVRDRISQLKENEIGYQQIQFVKLNGKPQQLIEHETIVEIRLDNPIPPKSKVNLEVAFKAQVPVQIRRSGRDNSEGIRYSMSQWYPKIAEYDYQGWNANPYIGREFYGVWGDYTVNITIDKNYIVAGTGVLQNANEIGYGYEDKGIKIKPSTDKTLTWKFTGQNIHDFVWAADPQYKHLSKKVTGGPTLHVFYKVKDASVDSAWNNVLWLAEKILPHIEKLYGKYPYPQYSFIQGGDGGMEYAMATLLKGPGLEGIVHEWLHSWYQHILGTNESLHSWMDEGFTTFAETETIAYYLKNFAPQSPYLSKHSKQELAQQLQDDLTKRPLHHAENYGNYFSLVKSGREESLTTHADHFNTNYAYRLASYVKGSVFLSQLGYIISDSLRDKVLLAYYDQWKFKHPNPNDFIRIAESLSNMELDWYKEYWIYSTKTIDYGLGSIDEQAGKAVVSLKRIGLMPMPVEVLVTYKDGTEELHYIPLNLMYGQKPNEETALNRIIHAEWKWTHPDYKFSLSRGVAGIKAIEIDPSRRMADINRINNGIIVPQ